MSDRFEIAFDSAFAQDLLGLDRAVKRRILDAVERKSTANPKQFGKPLGGEFAGLRRLRIANMRIVYQVSKSRVLVLAALPCEAIYQELAKRLKHGG